MGTNSVQDTAERCETDAVLVNPDASIEQAETQIRAGQMEEGLALARRCWTAMERHGDNLSQANCQRVLGLGYQHLGDYKESLRATYKAIDLFELANAPDGVARTLSLAAVSMARIGNAAEALDMLTRAYEITKGLSDVTTEFRVWLNMSAVHEALEEFDKAAAAAERALSLAQVTQEPQSIAHAKTKLCTYRVRHGLALNSAGQRDEAVRIITPELQVCREQQQACRTAGYTQLVATLMAAIGMGHLALGEIALARDALLEGLVFAQQAGMRTVRSSTSRPRFGSPSRQASPRSLLSAT